MCSSTRFLVALTGLTAVTILIGLVWISYRSSQHNHCVTDPLSDIPSGLVRDDLVALQTAETQDVANLDERELPLVSIISFSNGQDFCDENALLNVVYQKYPRDKIELVFYESNSVGPSARWKSWSNGKGGLDMWAKKSGSSLPTIKYRWFNGTAETRKGWQERKTNPLLGELRNLAMAESTGKFIVNMDNDDFYHPNYVYYMVDHLQNKNLDHLTLSPHALARIHPDGSVETSLDPADKITTGGHMVAFHRRTLKDCKYASNARVSEEFNFKRCIQFGYKNSSAIMNMTTGRWGNRLLLVKFSNPFSITRQRFFVDRNLYNRLSLEDLKAMRHGQSSAYLRLHESSRPEGVVDLVPFIRGRPYEEDARRAVPEWIKFKRRHRDFFAEDNFPFCKGFAGLPGQYFRQTRALDGTPSSLVMSTESVDECCQNCAKLFNKTFAVQLKPYTGHEDLNTGEDIYGNYSNGIKLYQHCTAFTYDIRKKLCHLGWGDIMYRPESILTHQTAIRVSLCPKCGDGLAQ